MLFSSRMSNLNAQKLPLILTEPFFQYDRNDIYLDSFFVYCSICSKRLLANNKFNLSALYSHIKGKKHIDLAEKTENNQTNSSENVSLNTNNTRVQKNAFPDSNNQNEIEILKQKIEKHEYKLKKLNEESFNYKKLAESIKKSIENTEKEMEILKNKIKLPKNDDNSNELLKKIKNLENENGNLRNETSKIEENISLIRRNNKEHKELILKNYKIKTKTDDFKDLLKEFKQEHELASNLNDLDEFLQELYNKIELTSMENRILKDQMVKTFI